MSLQLRKLVFLRLPLARGDGTIARGDWTVTRGNWKIARGDWKIAPGDWKIARGDWTVTRGDWKIARGDWKIARKLDSSSRTSEGRRTPLMVLGTNFLWHIIFFPGWPNIHI